MQQFFRSIKLYFNEVKWQTKCVNKKTFTFKGTALFHPIMIRLRRRGIHDRDMTLIFAISKGNRFQKCFDKLKKKKHVYTVSLIFWSLQPMFNIQRNQFRDETIRLPLIIAPMMRILSLFCIVFCVPLKETFVFKLIIYIFEKKPILLV